MKRMNMPRNFMLTIMLMFIIGYVSVYYLPLPAIMQINSSHTLYRHKNNLIDLNNLPNEIYYKEQCFHNELIKSIYKLEHNVIKWFEPYTERCHKLQKTFHDIYQIDIRKGYFNITSDLIKIIFHLLEDNDNIYEAFRNQEVLQIKNRYTKEQVVFNSMRSKRPIVKPDQDPMEYFNVLVKETEKSCIFCHYETMTAEDTFGRIKGLYSTTAANAFKLEKWHGLIFPNEHNSAKITLEVFLDLFNTSLKWFKKAHSLDRDSCYPMILYDNLPKGGASQIHPHIHGLLGSQYLSVMKIQEDAAYNYKTLKKRNYWSDVIEIHQALGLAVIHGNAIAISTITPIRANEIMILSSYPSTDLFKLFYYVIHTYYHKLQLMCFSSGLAFPSMCQKSDDPSLPAIIRIGTRSTCNSVRSDVGSLELYVVPSVSVDPYEIIKYLKQTMQEFNMTISMKNNDMVELFDNYE